MVSPFRYASIDDEPASHEALRVLMGAHADFLDHGRFFTPEAALQALCAAPVDLLFVDIEMPSMSGLEFLAASTFRCVSVLLTAHAEYALQAYELGVRDYLLKPISAMRLGNSLERLRPLLLLQRDAGSPESVAPLAFAVGRELRYVSPDDIRAIDAEGNFSTIVTADGKLFVSESLKALESRLKLFGFVRVHKGHLVNRRHVCAWIGDEIVLSASLKRPLGRAYRSSVKLALAG